MTDDLEPRVRELLADRGDADPALIAALLDGIAALPRRRARPWGLAAAVVAVALIALAGIIGLRPSSDPGGAPLAPDPTERPSPSGTTPSPSPSRPASPTVQPTPPWVADLVGQLDCDGPIVDVGQEVGADPSPFDPAPSPERAIEGLLESGMYAWLPAGGFEPPQVEGHWALHRYLVVGRLKVIAVSTNAFPEVPDERGWEVVGLRACDPSEFDPGNGLSDGTTLWLDAGGRLASTRQIFSRLGPEHCGWEEIVFLHLDRVQYLRDPDGLLADLTVGPFRTVDALPAAAIDTGLHTPEWQLFTVADERFVYVRDQEGTIERWARAKDTIGCA